MKEPIVIAAFGDSNTRGWRAGVHNYQAYRSVLERLLCEGGVPAVVVDAAQPGNTVVGGHQRFERDVLTRKPDSVTISFATNDASLSADGETPRTSLETYRAIHLYWLDALRSAKIPALFVTPPPFGASLPDVASRNERMKAYVEAVRSIAAQTGTPVIDVNAAFAAAQARGVVVEELLLPDGVHLNPQGHQFVAQTCIAWEREHGFFAAISAKRNACP